MPIEIRELIIKTEVRSVHHSAPATIKDHNIAMLRDQLLASCKRMINEQTKRTKYKR